MSDTERYANALDVDCQVCNALAGDPCTQAGRHQMVMPEPHFARVADSNRAADNAYVFNVSTDAASTWDNDTVEILALNIIALAIAGLCCLLLLASVVKVACT